MVTFRLRSFLYSEKDYSSIKNRQSYIQTVKTVLVTVSSSELTHLKKSKVKTVAKIPARERATPIMVTVSSTFRRIGGGLQLSWNLEQISWISGQ